MEEGVGRQEGRERKMKNAHTEKNDMNKIIKESHYNIYIEVVLGTSALRFGLVSAR